MSEAENSATALFGGSFDPPHCGHLALARATLEQTPAGRVVFIPAGQSPLKHHCAHATAGQRLAMLQAAIAGEPRFSILDWELRAEGPSYSIDTVLRYRVENPAAVLYWILGEDQVDQLERWQRIDELSRMVQFIGYQRASSTSASAAVGPLVDSVANGALRTQVQWLEGEPLSHASNDIRRAIASGLTPKGLPSAVAAYISLNSLYNPS